MAGRLAWVLAGGAAIVGGMMIQDGDMFSFSDERQIDRQIDREVDHEVDQEVDEAIAEATAAPDGRRIIVDGRSATDREAVRAMTDAVAELVKAETALAAAQIGDNDDPAEVAGARAQRDRARAEVERLKAQIEAKDGSEAARAAIREQVRGEVREAVRNN